MFLKYALEVIRLNRARLANRYIRPRFINFLLTYRCNARCAMCRIWDVYNQSPEQLKEELSAAQIKKFILDNREALSEVRNIGLSGGDPLLMRSDFVEIVRIFRSLLPQAHLGVQTNGLLPELAHQRLKQIVAFYPDFSLAVSIDGIGDTHAQVRGIPQAFEKADQTIRYAQGLGIRNITCGMTLNVRNFNQICRVKEYARGMGLEFSCFAPEVAGYFNNEGGGDLRLEEGQWQVIAEQLRECCGYHYFMDNLRLIREGRRKRALPCFSGFTSLVIDPYGNVKPCVLKVKGIEDDIFANIKNMPLKKMLNSVKASEIKNKIKQCSCWCQCEVSSSAMIYPWDILRWFVFYCPDKKGFLGHVLKKKDKYADLL